MTNQPTEAALQEAVRRLQAEAAKIGDSYLFHETGVAAEVVARLIQLHEPETLVDPIEEARKREALRIVDKHWPDASSRTYRYEAALAALTEAGWRPGS